jgi:hypothetical protein
MEKKIIKAKFTGLGKSGSITCETLNKYQHIFWPKHNLSKEEFGQLWNYQKGGEWTGKEIAVIECDDLSHDGTPINPVFLYFENI